MSAHKKRCQSHAGTEWSGSPAFRGGIEGWECDECGAFIPCEDSPSIDNCDDAGTGEGRYHGRI